MGAIVSVYNNGNRMAKTNRAFQAIITLDLMRDYLLDFNVSNLDCLRPYMIQSASPVTMPNGSIWYRPVTQFEAEGQMFDATKITMQSGTSNVTTVSAQHVSYRTNNYTLPVGYSFVGTAQQIIQDMLTQSGGSAEFSIGTCANVGTKSISLGNTQPITLRAALWSLTAIGVEVSYDNFKISAPTRWGADKGKVFEFGKDLYSITRDWNCAENPPTMSYTIGIVPLWRIAGSSALQFGTGDTVQVKDKFLGDSITGQRICTYKKCFEDPTKDTVIIGVFVPDAADTVVAQQMAINNSVQMGQTFNNNTVTRQNGFVSIAPDTSGNPSIRVEQSGTGGFMIQHSTDSGNTWNTIFVVDKDDGHITINSADNSKRVIMGSGNGFVIEQSADSGSTWNGIFTVDPSDGHITIMSEDQLSKVEMGSSNGFGYYTRQTIEYEWTLQMGNDGTGGSAATKIYAPGFPDLYGTIGAQEDGNIGLELFWSDTPYARIVSLSDGGVSILNDKYGYGIQLAENGVVQFHSNNPIGKSTTCPIGPFSMTFTNGLLSSITSGSVISANIPVSGSGTLHFTNGMLTSIS